MKVIRFVLWTLVFNLSVASTIACQPSQGRIQTAIAQTFAAGTLHAPSPTLTYTPTIPSTPSMAPTFTPEPYTPPPDIPVTIPPGCDVSYRMDFEDQVIALLNYERINNNVPTLLENMSLKRAARVHGVDMGCVIGLSHIGSDQSTFSQRQMAAGYSGAPSGELIASCVSSPEYVVQLWMSDPPHRDIILGNSTDVGVAFVLGDKYGCFWTVELGIS